MKPLNHTATASAFTYMLQFPLREHPCDTILHCLTERSRIHDELDDRSDPRSLGDDVLILWNRNHWSIENFIRLALTVRTLIRLRERMRVIESSNETGDPDADVLEYEQIETEVRAADDHAQLLEQQVRCGLDLDALLSFFFWLAVLLDTRAERIVCKHNHCLAKAGVGSPSPAEVRHLRACLQKVLRRVVQGLTTRELFARELTSAIATGTHTELPIPAESVQLVLFVGEQGFTDYERINDLDATAPSPLRLKIRVPPT